MEISSHVFNVFPTHDDIAGLMHTDVLGQSFVMFFTRINSINNHFVAVVTHLYFCSPQILTTISVTDACDAAMCVWWGGIKSLSKLLHNLKHLFDLKPWCLDAFVNFQTVLMVWNMKNKAFCILLLFVFECFHIVTKLHILKFSTKLH